MNAYEQKLQSRKDRLDAAADRAEAKSNAAYKRADLREEVSGIPFGQPILVGHHSEGRHRRAIERADNAMRASIEADRRAAELRAKAEGVGTAGISSDDPDAVVKLRAQLAEIEARREVMKARNAEWRKAGNKGGRQADGSWVDAPFASYQLTNIGANIRRIQKRVAHLEKAAERETVKTSYQGLCDIVENAEENRLQIIFPGKPSPEIRAELKRCGFRWAPSQNAWQRQLSNGSRYAAECVLRSMASAE
jgi:hypothetical protein